ncbi:hypothetical protein Bca4012_103649 [Brassica carinata]
MGGGAWPFLVGGAICLVNSVNERDLSLLTSYVEASLHGRLLRGTMASLNASCAPSLLAEGTSAWVSQIVVPPSSRGYGTEAGLPCVTARCWPKSELRAPGAPRHAVVNSSLVISSVVPVRKLDDPKSSTRPQVRRDHPLSLSISISGGKETNKDSLSNGERTGRAQLENRTSWRSIVVWRSVLSDGPGPSSLERGAREVRARRADPVAPRGAVYESGCLGMQPQSGGKFRPRLNMGETDGEQVPRGKDEKDFEKRVKECLKLSGGKRMGPAMRPGRMRNGAIRPPIDSVVDRRGLRRWPKPGFCYAAETPLP